jgi:hypothetical protein
VFTIGSKKDDFTPFATSFTVVTAASRQVIILLRRIWVIVDLEGIFGKKRTLVAAAIFYPMSRGRFLSHWLMYLSRIEQPLMTATDNG